MNSLFQLNTIYSHTVTISTPWVIRDDTPVQLSGIGSDNTAVVWANVLCKRMPMHRDVKNQFVID
jgi:hypothetical protein